MSALPTPKIIQADARALPLGDCSVDSIVTDPPYGLEFMGKEWDRLGGDGAMSKPGIGERQTEWPSYGGSEFGGANPTCSACGGRARGRRLCACERPHNNWVVKGRPLTSASPVPKPGNLGGFATGDKPSFERVRSHLPAMQAWHTEWATEALRVLKPGGHLLAFGGTRTYHRLACALEDAGWEIRDCLMWLYGSGFPKSKNIGGGWGTALKPAFEPIILARKPLSEANVAANVGRWGTGAVNVDGCRIPAADGVPKFNHRQEASVNCYGNGKNGSNRTGVIDTTTGRWPANVLLDEEAAAALDEQTGESESRIGLPRGAAAGDGWGMTKTGAEYNDSGGASRFFYVAKADRAERNAGCSALAEKPLNWSSGEQSPGTFQAEGTHKAARNHHPTVKPVQLMRYLCRLITPVYGLVLDCFTGSGTTGIAAVEEGFRFIGIERDPEYLAIARARLAHATRQGVLPFDPYQVQRHPAGGPEWLMRLVRPGKGASNG